MEHRIYPAPVTQNYTGGTFPFGSKVLLKISDDFTNDGYIAKMKELWYGFCYECSSLQIETDKSLIGNVDDETKTVKATVSYDSGMLNIKPESFLRYGKTYKVTLSGCMLESFDFTTAEAPLKVTRQAIKFVGVGGESDTIPQEGTFNAVCNVEVSNPSGAQATVFIVLVTYNEKRMIVNILPEEVQFSQTTLSHRVSIPGLTKANTGNVRCFVWNKTNLGYEMIE